MVNPGWMAVYGRDIEAEGEAPSLVPVQQNETVNTTKIDVQHNLTKPPPRYSEATLLSAMEGAGKLVEDEELREAMSEKGLGTPATRAAIIEGLIVEKYLIRQGRELIPTAKAFSLIELLRGLNIPELSSPDLTGNWEFKLKMMERGKLQRSDFMREIEEMTKQIVEKTKRYEHDEIPGEFGELKTPCPKCGGKIVETYKKFKCEKCDFSLWKIVAGRQFEPAEIEELLEKKQVGPLQGFRSKMGRPFAAIIKLTPDLKAEFDFGQDKQEEGNGAPVEVDFTGQEPVGKCLKCGSPVYEHGMNFACEKQIRKQGCDFRTGKIILQRPIEREQVKKLLETGKTDLLDKFISKKGRPFKAFLVWKDGRVSFEFEQRTGKAKAEKSKEPQPKIDFTGQESLGKCPKCGGKVFEGPDGYICEKSQADTKPCKFKIGKEILGQPVERDQAKKLLVEHKSDLLNKFISKAGRPFPAWLVMDDKGKITFEFPEREEKSV